MSTALASLRDRHLSVANQLEASRARLRAIIPMASGLDASRAIAVTLDALSRQPDLLDCEPRSIVRSVLHAAELGLELGSPLGEAFLVPFKKAATMMIGYRGFLRLILGAPRVTMAKGVLVYESDEFDVDEGANVLHHKRAKGTIKQRGDVTFAYSRVYYIDGSSQFEIMDRVELDRIKTDALKHKRGFSPWQSHQEEMMKKCPLRRQAKWLNLSPLARRGVERDDLEAMKRGELGALSNRDGSFDSGRADELRAMLEAKDAKVEVIDADIVEGGT
jgi:recombination protein RecT